MKVSVPVIFPSRVRAFAFASLLAAASLAAAASPASAEIPTGEPVDGIRCEAMEGSVFHIHQHVAIFDHGKPIEIPDSVGRPVLGNCFYWMHTHTPDGIIHVESPTFRSFTLGEFFDVWGQPLSAKRVSTAVVRKGERLRVWINGLPYSGDPRAIEMTQHADITLEVGPPYSKPAPFTDWQGQ